MISWIAWQCLGRWLVGGALWKINNEPSIIGECISGLWLAHGRGHNDCTAAWTKNFCNQLMLKSTYSWVDWMLTDNLLITYIRRNFPLPCKMNRTTGGCSRPCEVYRRTILSMVENRENSFVSILPALNAFCETVWIRLKSRRLLWHICNGKQHIVTCV